MDSETRSVDFELFIRRNKKILLTFFQHVSVSFYDAYIHVVFYTSANICSVLFLRWPSHEIIDFLLLKNEIDQLCS